MSIDAREWRIGNKFLNKKGEIDEVYRIEEEGINGSNDMYDVNDVTYEEVVDPIPLTPEILEKCGFVKCENHDFWKESNRGAIFYTMGEYHSFPIKYEEGEYRKYFACEDDFYSWSGNPLNSLHQLQNLYYALTNEELPISL